MSRTICGLLLFLLAALAACAQSLSIATPHPAHTFYTDESVQITVLAPGAARLVRYSILDYGGVRRAQGEVQVGNDDPGLVTPGPLPPGFYRLVLFDHGTRTEEPFCVIPRPYDEPGDYSIFGLHPGDGATERNLEVASQIGVRTIRQNIPWTVFEPQPGVYDTAWLNQWSVLGRKYGMQMMYVLGFTPKFVGEKPANPDGWVGDAWFIWHPKDPNAWAQYLKQAMRCVQGQTVPWPSRHVSPTLNPPATQQLPLAASWELWNEADLFFYEGDWGRYLELLHLGWASGRTMLPDVPMIYGGSTGNFPAMGVAASGTARFCFDYIALHTGGDLEKALRVWYSGAQQIPWCVGMPRETMHTECYAQGRRGTVEYTEYQETPAELRRTYLTLKAWREAGFYRSGCLGGFIQSPGDMAPGTALLIPHDDHLDPTPLYPAFAATRRLLSDAVEVGPVTLGDKITAHVFLKHGKPMLAAWSDDGARATIALATRSYEVDPFGVRRSFGTQRAITRTLTASPLVIIGVDARYLREAVRARYRLLSETHYGTTQTDENCLMYYVGPLNQDLDYVLGTGAATRLATYVNRAADQLATAPSKGPAAAVSAQRVCFEMMKRLLATCQPGEAMPKIVGNGFWRLSHISEWLGEIADDRAAIWDDLQVSREELNTLTRRLQTMRTRTRAYNGDGELPWAEQLLDRAQRQLPRLQRCFRRGTYTAISDKVTLSQLLCSVERPQVLRVAPIVDFTSSRCFRKARLLEPAQQHTVTVWAYNYLDHAVSGELTVKFPATWSPSTATVPFTAAAGAPSTPTAITVTLPDTPTPWNTVSSFTMSCMINLSLPSSLEDRPVLELSGRLSDGSEITPTSYWVNVGRWVDDPAPAGAASTAGLSKAAPSSGASAATGNEALLLAAQRRWAERIATGR